MTGPWPKCGWKTGNSGDAVAEAAILVFVGVPTVEAEVESVISECRLLTMTGPKPKFMGKSEKISYLLDGASVLIGTAPAIAVNIPATLLYSGLKEGVLSAMLVKF